MTNHEIWQAVLSELELSPKISKPNFNTWFKNTGISKYENGEVEVLVPSTFNQAWLEKKYHQMIVTSLERVNAKPIKKLEYKIGNVKNIANITEKVVDEAVQTNPETNNYPDQSNSATPFTNNPLNKFKLNPKYVFDRYVVGGGSELAYAAAQAVINKPGEAYNPLFIYGGVGLGKTHLLQSIGNELLKKNPRISKKNSKAKRVHHHNIGHWHTCAHVLFFTVLFYQPSSGRKRRY